MLSVAEKNRYGKQIILPEIGIDGQTKLAAAKALVIGAGGLGCPVLQYLGAAGVGTLGIIDGDNVELSNLQRQVLYNNADIGKSKAHTAAQKIAALNPNVKLFPIKTFINHTNALELIKEYDIIIDGSDNFPTRYLVNDACVMLNKPMVSGAIYKFEGQVSVFNYKGGPTYRCIFPDPPGEGESPNCADIGVIATLPGIIGSIQANEVIKIITGIGEPLSGKLLVMDTLTMATNTFQFKLNPDNLKITALPETKDYCKVEAITSIEYSDLKSTLSVDKDAQLVDVREIEEHQLGNIGGINLPLSRLSQLLHKLNKDNAVVVYCASGIRSMHAARLLQGNGFTKIINLNNGVSELLMH